jgi:hypothetical protein
MIGAHRHGFNVFFLTEDEDSHLFPEVSIQPLFIEPSVQT